MPDQNGGLRSAFPLSSALLISSMIFLNLTQFSTALPKIIAQLHGLELYEWVNRAYLYSLFAALFITLAVRFNEKSGKILIYIVSILFSVSVLMIFTQSMGQLIGFRFAQGLCAGAVLPDIMMTCQKRGNTGLWLFAFSALSYFAGPAVGGFLTDAIGWRYGILTLNLILVTTAFTILLFASQRTKNS